MLIRKAPDLRFSDITPKSLYLGRREFLQTAAGAAVGVAAAAAASPFVANVAAAQQKEGVGHGAKLAGRASGEIERPAAQVIATPGR